MTANVISHRGPRRKRSAAYAARRLGALALTAGALARANWLAPPAASPQVPAAPASLPLAAVATPPTAQPLHQEIDVALDIAAPAAELAATSQARD